MAPKDSTATGEATGASKYMSMYGKYSTDGFLRIGNECPDFSCKTTHGYMSSFHDWKKGQWALLCSHPRAFHPVGTTELGSLSKKYEELKSIGCKVVALSVDSVEDHQEWLKDVESYHKTDDSSVKVKFPIISDSDRNISEAYSMIDPYTLGRQTLTVRSVFVISPDNTLMLRLDYPASVGRNMDEIIRCIMALQLSYEHSIQTPANWPHHHATLPDKNGSPRDYTGAVFLLPTVTKEEADKEFAGYHTCPVPSGKNYIRMVRPEKVGMVQDDDSSAEFSSSTTTATTSAPIGTLIGIKHKQKPAQQPKDNAANKSKSKSNKGLSRWFKASK